MLDVETIGPVIFDIINVNSSISSFSIEDIKALDDEISGRSENMKPFVDSINNPTITDLFGNNETKRAAAFIRIDSDKKGKVDLESWMRSLPSLLS